MFAHCCRLVALTLGFFACSLDDRQLQLAPDEGAAGTLSAGKSGAGPVEGGASEGGTSEGGANEGGASNGSGSGGGAGDGVGELVDGCADLDTDGVADCTTTMLENPTFARDISGWDATGGGELTWDAKNALGDLPSGSVKLDAAAKLSSATQCVSLQGRQVVIAYASAFVVGGDEMATAQLAVSFFAATDCSGEREGYFETPASAVTDAWTTLHAGGLSRETTSSVSIALVGVRAASASELNAYFDNVMLKAQAP